MMDQEMNRTEQPSAPACEAEIKAMNREAENGGQSACPETEAALRAETKKGSDSSLKYGITAMILGIASLATTFVANIALAIISLCFVAKSKRESEDQTMNKFSVAGMVCSIVSLSLAALTLLVLILVFAIFGSQIMEYAEQIAGYFNEFDFNFIW